MLKRTLVTLLCMATVGAVYAQAYKYVDENGVTVYSDRPSPGAESVELPTAPTTQWSSTRRRPTAASRRDKSEREQGPAGYQILDVASPAAEETLWNIAGSLNVTLVLQPVLQQGDRLRVYFDGVPHQVFGMTLEITDVHRGAHSIQAEIVDQAGKLKIRSKTNRFYVQQTSIANKSPGNN